MGTIITWLILSGGILLVLHIAWSDASLGFNKALFDKYRPHVLAILLVLISLAVYGALYLDTFFFTGIFDQTSFVPLTLLESFFSIAHFRNAFFGILIAILTHYWFEQRIARAAPLPDVPGAGRPAARYADLPLLLIVVITVLAITFAELPGILKALRIGFGSDGLTFELKTRDQPPSASRPSTEKDGGLQSARLPSLGVLVYLTTQGARDNEKICALGRSQTPKTEGADFQKSSCNKLTQLKQYKDLTDTSLTPAFSCMNAIVTHSQNYSFALGYIRPVIHAYMHSILSREKFDRLPTTVLKELDYELTNFFRLMKNTPLLSRLCTDQTIDEYLKMDVRWRRYNLGEIFSLYEVFPYGSIAYAILAKFLETPAAGILPLEKWQTKQRENFKGNFSKVQTISIKRC